MTPALRAASVRESNPCTLWNNYYIVHHGG